uniref:Obg domain-containing protein n=1 Tax=Oryza punctata TaxID=4537 RepID=A0A0E0MLH0_ORYPU
MERAATRRRWLAAAVGYSDGDGLRQRRVASCSVRRARRGRPPPGSGGAGCSPPGSGGGGGNVVVYAGEAEETLLRFHEKARYCAKRRGNVGVTGSLSSRMHNGFAGETLRIPVPVGTVVKLKKAAVLADLAHPGDEVIVARGGQGGLIDVLSTEGGKPWLYHLISYVMLVTRIGAVMKEQDSGDTGSSSTYMQGHSKDTSWMRGRGVLSSFGA